MNKKYFLSASLLSADILHLENDLKALERAGIDYLHFDVMDGHFVPRIGLYPEMLRAIKSVSKIPIDVHLMMESPEPYIPLFAKNGADIIVVHAEPNMHIQRTLKLIRECGAKAGLCLNIHTPLNILDYILDDLDLVMLMAINPGIVGHNLIPAAMKKIKDLSEKLKLNPDILIEIDGGVTSDTGSEMVALGADILISGRAIFSPEKSIEGAVLDIRSQINTGLEKYQ